MTDRYKVSSIVFMIVVFAITVAMIGFVIHKENITAIDQNKKLLGYPIPAMS